MIKPEISYSDEIQKWFGIKVMSFTFQVTEDCNLYCTYCYQGNKTKKYMTFKTAKDTVDFIFKEAKNPDSILSYDVNGGIVFDYIGGEPFLCADLIYDLIKYIEEKMIEENSPWLLFHRHSFSSNGTLYFTDKVQQIIRDFSDVISISVTVDGCKELHDQCRVFKDGSGSYDLAIKAALDQLNHFGNDATKITLSPYNIKYTSKAIINMLQLGFKHIHANCVFEEGWTEEHADILYKEMLILADYVREHQDCYVNILDDANYQKYIIDCADRDNNWCGGDGSMIAVDPDGTLYPCVRYTSTSLGPGVKPVVIGSIYTGIYNTKESCELYKEMKSMTRTSQSTKECIECNIASGCSWCSAFNYQTFKQFNKRATFICVMHKAMAKACEYFWR